MRFSVPQFIDVEDKIFGPFTLKQAIYIAGGCAVPVAIFIKFGFFGAILFGGPFTILAAALAFFKVNNRPFYLVVYAGFFFSIRNKLYLWKRVPKKKKPEQQVAPTTLKEAPAPKLSQSRLKELAWSLDTRDNMYTRGE